MSNTNPIPDFFDISEAAQKTAAAAMSVGAPLKVPADAVRSEDKQGNVRFRWTEGAVIEGAWREGTKEGNNLVVVVQLKMRSGYPNEHQRFWARHYINPRLMNGTATDEERKKHEFMNNNSLNALMTLLSATGYMPKGGGVLSAALLRTCFPAKDTAGVTTPLLSKAVMVNLCDAPNKGDKQQFDRKTQAETYLIDAPVS